MRRGKSVGEKFTNVFNFIVGRNFGRVQSEIMPARIERRQFARSFIVEFDKVTTRNISRVIQALDIAELLTSCGSISGHLVTIPYQIIKHIPTSALLEA